MAFTHIHNPTTKSRHYGFIPPHGHTLPPGGSVVMHGDLVTVLAGGRGRYSRRTELTSLDKEVRDGNVQIVVTANDPGSSSSTAI